MHAMSCTFNALPADYYLCYVLLHRKMTGATGESVTFTLPTGTTQLVTLSCILLGNLHAQWANDPPLLLRMLPAFKSDKPAAGDEEVPVLPTSLSHHLDCPRCSAQYCPCWPLGCLLAIPGQDSRVGTCQERDLS